MATISERQNYIRAKYPEGLVMYHQRDEKLAESARKIISTELPGYAPLVDDYTCKQSYLTLNYWGTDSGGQLRGTIYGNSEFSEMLISGLRKQYDITDLEARSLLPPMKISRDYQQQIENGLCVPIAGTDNFFHGTLESNSGTIFQDSGVGILDARQLRGQIINKEQQKHGAIVVMSGHIDTRLSGFKTGGYASIYLSENQADFGMQIATNNDGMMDIATVPHDVAVRGGLNIRYMRSQNNMIAALPSFAASSPLVSRLRHNGYKIVEFGADQVLPDGSGIKWRMVPISWRDAQDNR